MGHDAASAGQAHPWTMSPALAAPAFPGRRAALGLESAIGITLHSGGRASTRSSQPEIQPRNSVRNHELGDKVDVVLWHRGRRPCLDGDKVLPTAGSASSTPAQDARSPS